MDRIKRTYAHQAAAGLDPLADLEPAVRRAILLMPSTFRERLKLAPWTSRDTRRQAILEILAERRLAFELFQTRPPMPAVPAPPLIPPQIQPVNPPAASTALSPYYQRRMEQWADQRRQQDQRDIEMLPRARSDAEQRAALRERYHAIQLERARLDREEARLMSENGSWQPPHEPTFPPTNERSLPSANNERGSPDISPAAAIIPPEHQPRKGRGR